MVGSVCTAVGVWGHGMTVGSGACDDVHMCQSPCEGVCIR